MSFRFASTWWLAHSLRSTRSACSTGVWWVVTTCCWLDGAIAFVWFVVGLQWKEERKVSRMRGWSNVKVMFLPVIQKLLSYYLLNFASILDHLSHNCRVVRCVIATRDRMMTSISILTMIGFSALLINERCAACRWSWRCRKRHWIIARTCRHKWWRRRLMIVLELRQIEFSLLGMEPRRLDICRLLYHFVIYISIGHWWWDRKYVLCIYRRCGCRNNNGNRLNQLVVSVDGLSRNDKELVLLIVYRANTANYRCWNLRRKKEIELNLPRISFLFCSKDLSVRSMHKKNSTILMRLREMNITEAVSTLDGFSLNSSAVWTCRGKKPHNCPFWCIQLNHKIPSEICIWIEFFCFFLQYFMVLWVFIPPCD